MTDTPPFKLGFIGGGITSAVGQTHFAACRMDGFWEITAGCFSDKLEHNLQTARTWNISSDHVYCDWREMVRKEKHSLHAVVVLTPTPHHVEVLTELLDAGIAIICEKAMVASLQEVKLVHSHFNPEKNFLAVTFNYSGYPMVRELRHRVKCGDLGNIQQIHLEMPQEGFVRPPDISGKPSTPQAWRLRDGIIPTVCLDLGVHLHHLVSFVTGLEPLKVAAHFSNHSDYKNIVDTVCMMLLYEHGTTGNFWFTKTAIGHRNGLRIRLFGERGSAEWIQSFPEELHLNSRDGSRCVVDRAGRHEVCSRGRYNRMKVGHPSGFIEAFANLYVDIAHALTSHIQGQPVNSPYVYGLEHAAHGLKLFEAARRSWEKGAWMSIG